jgi:hypothetical protein
LQITIIGLEWDGSPGVHMFYPSPAKMFKLLFHHLRFHYWQGPFSSDSLLDMVSFVTTASLVDIECMFRFSAIPRTQPAASAYMEDSTVRVTDSDWGSGVIVCAHGVSRVFKNYLY